MRTRSLVCTAVIALLLLPFGSAWLFVKAQATPTIHFENPNNIFTTAVASVGTTFNLSVLVDNAPDYGGVEVYMEFNDSIVNATRWFEPISNSSYILFGLPSSTLPAPPNVGYHHIGLNRGQIQISVNKGGFPPVAPWCHSGLAMIIEFNITAAPTIAGDKFTSDLAINFVDTFMLDTEGVPISPVTIQDGYYEISKPGAPPPSGFTLTIVASTGGSTNPAPGDHSYAEGASASVQANPDTGYHFDHWDLDLVNVGSVNPYSVTMDKNHTLNAFFLINNYTLTITASSGGTTNPAPGAYSYNYGTSVSVSATANANYILDHWEKDTINSGSANPFSITMDNDHTLKAVFNQSFTLTIVVTTGGSTNPPAGDHQYASGFVVSVQANPDVGHHLDHWELDLVNVGSVNPYSVTMDKNHTLNAFFLINNYTLTITASSGGTTDPVPGIYSYAYGTSVSANATADAKYIFDHWELDAAKVGSANPYLVTMNDNHTLKAVFVLVGEGLKGDVNGDGKVDGKDLFSAIIAFGTYGPDSQYLGSPQHPRWDARCDLNKDDKVNLIDFFIICINFGKTNA